MITIPSNNLPTFEKVLGSLGGENYSYYVFDVKHIEEPDSNKKVQIALKIFVHKDQRLLAVDNIRDGLNSENLVASTNPLGRRYFTDLRLEKVDSLIGEPIQRYLQNLRGTVH